MIHQFTSDMDFETFRADPMAVSAVERKLQIISEAAVRLAEEAERPCPGLPWRDIRESETSSGIRTSVLI